MEKGEMSMNVYFGDEVQTLAGGRAELNMLGSGVLRMTSRTNIRFPTAQERAAKQARQDELAAVNVGFGQAILNLLGFGATPKYKVGESFFVNTPYQSVPVGCEGRLEDGPSPVFTASFEPTPRGGPFVPGDLYPAPQTKSCTQKMQVTRIAGAIVEMTVDPTTGKTSVRVISKNPDGVVLTRITQDDQGLGTAARRAWLRLEAWEATLAAAPPARGPRPASPPPSVAAPTPAAPDYGAICRSAMTAIERGQRAVFGPQAQVRIEWARPFSYDKGDCVGGYTVWVKRPEDPKEWSPSKFFADSGDGRVAAAALVRQYQKDNPDLQWTP